MEVQTSVSDRRDMPLSIEMVGTTLGIQDVPILTRVEGFLETMNFQEGTFVEKDQLLYTVDPQPFQAKLVEAQSQLAAAQTNLAKAAADLSRIRPLAEMKAVSEQAENLLSVLLGQNPGSISRTSDKSPKMFPPDIPAGLPSELLERRPDIRQASQELAAQTAKIGVAEALRFPSLGLTGSLPGD